jgi:hypothetical protein
MSGLLNNPFTIMFPCPTIKRVRYPTPLEVVKVHSLLMEYPPNGHMTNRVGYRQVYSVYTWYPQASQIRTPYRYVYERPCLPPSAIPSVNTLYTFVAGKRDWKSTAGLDEFGAFCVGKLPGRTTRNADECHQHKHM